MNIFNKLLESNVDPHRDYHLDGHGLKMLHDIATELKATQPMMADRMIQIIKRDQPLAPPFKIDWN